MTGYVISLLGILVYCLITVPYKLQERKRSKRNANIARLEAELGYSGPEKVKDYVFGMPERNWYAHERAAHKRKFEEQRPYRLRKRGVWLPGDKR